MQTSEDFFVEQISTNCLALFSYYIESEKEAIVIDPLREPEGILKLLETRGAKLKYIFETHFHADFVSGHVELAQKTGATIVYGPTAKPNFEIKEAKDGEEIKLGKVTFKVLHTPGHTPESTTYLLLTPEGKQHSIYTGDTLFLGEVGRPDLAVKGDDITEQDLAGWLYDSLRNKILPLEDTVIVYPAHGAGSACGKKIQSGSSDTLGNQKKTNYALQEMTREEFVIALTTGIPKPPSYFFHDVALNKNGPIEVQKVIEKSLNKLNIDEFKKAVAEGAFIIDTRAHEISKKGFIKGAICLALPANFAQNVGAIIPPKSQLVLICTDGTEKETITRLARVGYEDVIGYLEGGVTAWTNAGGELEKWVSIESSAFKEKLGNKPNVLDVRNRGEWEDGVVDGAQLISLPDLHTRVSEVPKDKEVYVHCKLGGRSFMAFSILKKFDLNPIDVIGGVSTMIPAGIELVKPTF